MILARINGHVTSTVGHPSLKGQKIVLCTLIDEKGNDTDSVIAAIDPLGGGLHANVFITTDGSWSQNTVHDETSPIRNQVIGIID